MATRTFGVAEALTKLRPGCSWYMVGLEYSGITWTDTTKPCPSEVEVNDCIALLNAQWPIDQCGIEAKRRIAETDWSVLSDVNLMNKSDFEAYRTALRLLIINPVADPVWPVEPAPVWPPM